LKIRGYNPSNIKREEAASSQFINPGQFLLSALPKWMYWQKHSVLRFAGKDT
jgi:hypothetical protein